MNPPPSKPTAANAMIAIDGGHDTSAPSVALGSGR